MVELSLEDGELVQVGGIRAEKPKTGSLLLPDRGGRGRSWLLFQRRSIPSRRDGNPQGATTVSPQRMMVSQRRQFFQGCPSSRESWVAALVEGSHPCHSWINTQLNPQPCCWEQSTVCLVFYSQFSGLLVSLVDRPDLDWFPTLLLAAPFHLLNWQGIDLWINSDLNCDYKNSLFHFLFVLIQLVLGHPIHYLVREPIPCSA